MNTQLRRLALDLGPLVVFFIAFQFFGIYVATAVFMAVIVVSLGLGYALERRLSPMAIITAVIVLVFGGLTLYLRNDIFIKMKPTVIYGIFSLLLLGGLAFGRPFVKTVMSQAIDLTEEGWRGLTLRWGLFFLGLAALNEIVWRHFSTASWVTFKVWAVVPLIFVFALTQTPYLLKHQVPEKPAV